jgi:hypothetical protein
MTKAFVKMGVSASKVIDPLSRMADAHRRIQIHILSAAIDDDWRPLSERLRYRWRRRQVRAELTRSVEKRLARNGWEL